MSIILIFYLVTSSLIKTAVYFFAGLKRAKEILIVLVSNLVPFLLLYFYMQLASSATFFDRINILFWIILEIALMKLFLRKISLRKIIVCSLISYTLFFVSAVSLGILAKGLSSMEHGKQLRQLSI